MKNNRKEKLKKKKFDFATFTEKASNLVGSFWSFLVAFLFVIIWFATGPLFHYSEIWQLVINTATTIITFLIVFLIQHSQNRDVKILNLKLDELIRALDSASNSAIDLSKLSDEGLLALEKEYVRICRAEKKNKAPHVK